MEGTYTATSSAAGSGSSVMENPAMDFNTATRSGRPYTLDYSGGEWQSRS